MAVMIVMKISMIIMVVYATAAMALLQTDQEPVAVNLGGTSDLATKREQRSLFLRGLQLFMNLVDRAVQISAIAKHTTYKKKGNYWTAMNDFRSLRPYYVRLVKLANGKYAKEGTVGDYKVFVYKDGNGETTVLDFIAVTDNAKAGKPTDIYTIKYDSK